MLQLALNKIINSPCWSYEMLHWDSLLQSTRLMPHILSMRVGVHLPNQGQNTRWNLNTIPSALRTMDNHNIGPVEGSTHDIWAHSRWKSIAWSMQMLLVHEAMAGVWITMKAMHLCDRIVSCPLSHAGAKKILMYWWFLDNQENIDT
jgi:hypothetical protein